MNRLERIVLKSIMVLTAAVIISFCLAACGGKGDDMPSGNAVYYWRTTLKLSDAEREFLKSHDIRTVYTRFFDVVEEGGRLRPEGTLIFAGRMPDSVEIVPTVFIDSRALRTDSLAVGLAPLILARVDSMMSKNCYAPARELQIDFDWTAGNAKRYFSLLQELADSLHSRGRLLSTTIRLHQLTMAPPPADYGVLMVYNIGNFKDIREENSIISTRRLKEYIGNLGSYPLPLRGALPLYEWALLFHEGRFRAIVRGVDLNDTTLFRRIDETHLAARKYMPLPTGTTGASPDGRIYPGDIIRHEQASAATLDTVNRMLRSERKDIGRRTILYHLDQETFKSFSNEEIDKIYSGRQSYGHVTADGGRRAGLRRSELYAL